MFAKTEIVAVNRAENRELNKVLRLEMLTDGTTILGVLDITW